MSLLRKLTTKINDTKASTDNPLPKMLI